MARINTRSTLRVIASSVKSARLLVLFLVVLLSLYFLGLLPLNLSFGQPASNTAYRALSPARPEVLPFRLASNVSKHDESPLDPNLSSAWKTDSPAVILEALHSALAGRSVRLIITQFYDLVEASSFLRSSFLNPDVPMTRVGVFEEDLPQLRSALDEFMRRKIVGVTRKDVWQEDPRRWRNQIADGEMGKRERRKVVRKLIKSKRK